MPRGASVSAAPPDLAATAAGAASAAAAAQGSQSAAKGGISASTRRIFTETKRKLATLFTISEFRDSGSTASNETFAKAGPFAAGNLNQPNPAAFRKPRPPRGASRKSIPSAGETRQKHKHTLSISSITSSRPSLSTSSDLTAPESPSAASSSESFTTSSSDYPDQLLAPVLATALASFLPSDLCGPLPATEQPPPSPANAVFFSTHVQPFTLDYYGKRIVKYVQSSPSTLFAAVSYTKRISESLPELKINEYNIHRIFLASVVLAVKYIDDEVFTNAHYSKVGGITLDEMNRLELQALKLLKWNLTFGCEDYKQFVNEYQLDRNQR